MTDRDLPAEEIANLMRERGLGVVGLRHEGLVAGFFEIPEDPRGLCTDYLRSFDDARVLHDSAPLDEVIQALDEEPRLRNNLAHSQDIITTDWEAIVDLSSNMRQILNPPNRRRSALDSRG